MDNRNPAARLFDMILDVTEPIRSIEKSVNDLVPGYGTTPANTSHPIMDLNGVLAALH